MNAPPPLRPLGSPRTRGDRCPGVLRPWRADDGLLVRLRLVGGQLPSRALSAVLEVAEEYGDGRVHLTGRANLQLRGMPGMRTRLHPDVVVALERTGLLPSRRHERIRNLLVSPQTGLAEGRADLRPVAERLDRLLLADPRYAGLPGRFLVVLDDRGDLHDRATDLGVTALDSHTGQLRIGDDWGPVVSLADAATAIAGLAGQFLDARGVGAAAPWHVRELPVPLIDPVPADRRLPAAVPALAFGDVPGGRHVPAPGGFLDRALVERLTADCSALVVTPWRGVLVPAAAPATQEASR